MDENGCSVGLPLDSTHNAQSWENHPKSELEPTSASAESEAGSRAGTASHTQSSSSQVSSRSVGVDGGRTRRASESADSSASIA